jgi:hypothetical protein
MMIIPSRLPGYAAQISENAGRLGIGGLGITDAGTALYGSYGQKEQYMRSDATPYMTESFDTLGQSGLGLLFSNANAYALPYASAVADLPADGSGRRAVSRSVPFVQQVLENEIPYSMAAYNADMMSWNGFAEYLLKAVETRSALKFIFTQGSELAFHSALNKSNGEFQAYYQPFYYMTRYDRWADTIGDAYRGYNEFYKATAGAETTRHEVLDNGLVSVAYDNGVTVLINYAGEEKTADGQTVGAMSFLIM